MPVPDFSPGEVLTASAMDSIGLWLIKTQTLNAVSNDITSCFSSTYDSYRVVVSDLNTATATVRALNVRLLVGTTPAITNDYGWSYNLAYGTNLGGNTSTMGTSSWEVALASNRAGQSLVMEFNSPNKTTTSTILFQSYTYQSDVNSYIIRQGGGGHNVATAYNGFRIYGVTDALSGTVRVYGYRN